MDSQGRHALVLGASGITGWAIVNAILEGYPTADAFTRVTAVTNRPLTREASGWPSGSRLDMVSGIDLLGGDQTSLNELMREKIPSVDTVSHLYFYGLCFPEKSLCCTIL
jgi:nucleoside-diphosphate-sugar epimerase